MKPKFHLQYSVKFPRPKTLLNLNNLLYITPIQNPQKMADTELFPTRKITTSQSVTRIKHKKLLQFRKNLAREDQLKRTLLTNIKDSLHDQKTVRKNPKITLGFPKSKTKLKGSSAGSSIQHFQSRSVKLQKFNMQFQKFSSTSLNKIDNKPKQFLRKRSMINRQIIISLLKVKMSQPKYDEEKNQQFETQDILKMIKVYKGFSTNQNQQNLQNDLLKLSQSKQISGWENQPILQQY